MGQVRASEAPAGPELPWVGLRPYQAQEHAFFFGRAAELRALLGHLASRPLTVLHSPAGAGRTSLLRAGVQPALQAPHWLPVPVDALAPDGAPTVGERFFAALLARLNPVPRRTLARFRARHAEQGWPEILWLLFHDPSRGYQASGAPWPAFIVDDFDLVLQRGGQVAEEFRRLLSCLASPRPPAELHRLLWHDAALARRLENGVHRARILLSLRSDALGGLTQWEEEIPALAESGFTLGGLRGEDAFQAAYEPGTRRASAPPILRPASAKQLVKLLSGTAADPVWEKIEVAPALLSHVCAGLNAARREAAQVSTEELPARVDALLAGLLDQALASHPPAVRRMLTKRLGDGMGPAPLITEGEFLAGLTLAHGGSPGAAAAAVEAFRQLVSARVLTVDTDPAGGDSPAVRWLHPVLARHQRTDEEISAVPARPQRWLTAAALLALGLAAGMSAWLLQSQPAAVQPVFPATATVPSSPPAVPFRDSSSEESTVMAASRSERSPDLVEVRAAAGQKCDREAFARLADVLEKHPASRAALNELAGLSRRFHGLSSLLGVGSHAAAVRDASFSPDGRRFVTASQDGTAALWDATAARPLAILRGHEGGVKTARFSPDGRRLLTVGEDRTARVWDTADGRELARLAGHAGPVTAAAFSADGRLVITGGSKPSARVWKADGGQLVATFDAHLAPVESVAFSADGQRALTASADSCVSVWDARDGLLLRSLQARDGDAGRLAIFSADGRRIITATSRSHAVRVWQAETEEGELLTASGHKGPIRRLRLSPDGLAFLTASDDGTVRVWRSDTADELLSLPTGRSPLRDAQWSADGTRILTATEDGTMSVWESFQGTRRDRWEAHPNAVNAVAFHPAGDRVLSASDDGTARLWEAVHDPLVEALAGHTKAVWSVQFSPDGGSVATASEDHTAMVWDAGHGRLRHTLAGHRDAVTTVRFAPDGARLATCSKDGTARIWNVADGREIQRLEGHEKAVSGVCFSPDGTQLATVSNDATGRLWDATTGRLQSILRGHADVIWTVRYSPDGRQLLTTSRDRTARLWDTATGSLLRTLEGHAETVESGAWSHDGRWVLTASKDSTARVWEAASGRSTRTLSGHVGQVLRVEWSPDDTRILTTGEDGTARLWPAEEGSAPEVMTGHSKPIFAATFSPDSERVYTAALDADVRGWDAHDGSARLLWRGHAQGITALDLSPDGRRLATASFDQTAVLWTELFSAAGPAPAWLPDFLRWLAAQRTNAGGAMVPLVRGELEPALRRAIPSDSVDPWAAAANWHLERDPTRRGVHPWSALTLRHAADALLAPPLTEGDVLRAQDLDPTHPLLPLALAGLPADVPRAAFLRALALRRLETERRVNVLARAAALLAQQEGQLPAARRLVERALALDAGHPTALELSKTLREAPAEPPGRAGNPR